jgi:hypothetical protein
MWDRCPERDYRSIDNASKRVSRKWIGLQCIDHDAWIVAIPISVSLPVPNHGLPFLVLKPLLERS